MLAYILLLLGLLATSCMANQAAGKWQLLFYYEAYRYQADALGLANTEMAVDCRTNGGICNLEDFVKHVCASKTLPKKDSNGNVIKVNNKPILYKSPDFSVPDWTSIGDGSTFNQAKFSSEMDKVDFKGEMNNPKIFKRWNKEMKSFATVMDETQRIVLKASDQLKKNGANADNDRFKAIQNALTIHANARRYDHATTISNKFIDFGKKQGFTPKIGNEEISRPPVASYKKIDAGATLAANPNLSEKGATAVRNFVSEQNAAGNSNGHVEAISKATEVQKKFAEACKST